MRPPDSPVFFLLCQQGNFGGKVWAALKGSLNGDKKKKKEEEEASREAQMSDQVKGGGKPSELPFI